MKISQIIVETSTTAGSVSTVSKPLGEVQSRTTVAGLEPAEKVMKGSAKKKGPYANSISEGKKKIKEADLSEDDVILVPGKGLKVKPGFHKHDPDKAEHEGQTLKNSLHTIIRVATHLNKELSTRDNFPEWVSEKIGAVKSNMVTVMDYLISAKEMQHGANEGIDIEGAGVVAGGAQYESQLDELSKDTLKSYVKKQPERIKGPNGLSRTNTKKAERIVDPEKGDIRKALTKLKDPKYGNAEPSMKEGAKVDRMVKHITKSEKKLGHSKKEAENIAWATANKRGMLDNKNKKK